MLFDAHAHLNFSAFKEDLDRVVKRCLENQIRVINAGSQYSTSRRAVEIAEKYPEGIYAAVGLHPVHLETGLVKIKADPEEIRFKTQEEEFDYEKYKALALSSKKVVAVGEIGLDYYWKPKTRRKRELFKQKQKEVLLKQLTLAKELSLPVIFHCRMAHRDLIEFLKENLSVKPERAVAHGFVGNRDELKEYLNLGYYVGFNGIIFKRIEGIDFERNIRETPLERMLVETDCPYLTPPALGEKRNEPVYLKYIVEKIAETRSESFEKVAEKTCQNAKDLFSVS